MKICPNGKFCRLGRIYGLHPRLRAGKEIVCWATVAVLRKNAAVSEIEYIPPGYFQVVAPVECFTFCKPLCCVKCGSNYCYRFYTVTFLCSPIRSKCILKYYVILLPSCYSFLLSNHNNVSAYFKMNFQYLIYEVELYLYCHICVLLIIF